MIAQLSDGVGGLVRDRGVQSAAGVVSLPVAATTLHAVGLSTDVNAQMLSQGLVDPGLWFMLGMAASFGAIGGVVSELLSLHGRIELPHRARRYGSMKRSRFASPHHEFDLGIISRMLLGAMAAIALLSVYAPPSATLLVANALIAGSAATGVFRLVQGRMLGRGDSAGQRSHPSAWTRSSTRALHAKSSAPQPSAV